MQPPVKVILLSTDIDVNRNMMSLFFGGYFTSLFQPLQPFRTESMNTWMEFDAAKQVIREDIAVVKAEVAAGRGEDGWVKTFTAISDVYFSNGHL